MFGQLCCLPLFELLLGLWELLPLGELPVLGAAVVVVLVLVVLDEPAALAIAAPPPTAAPVIASAVSMVVSLRLISLTSFLHPAVGVSPDDPPRR